MLKPGYESEVAAVVVVAKPDLSLSAPQQRAQDPDFLARCSITAVAQCLPLPWPTPPKTPPSPKRSYRSHYQPPSADHLPGLDRTAWENLALFDLIVHLVDFSGLRPVLAQKLYRRSARGRTPFDPLSLLLLFGWQLTNRWKRTETLRHLAEPRYADYAAAFGFEPGVYPTEAGLRYFLTTLGEHNLTDLLVQSMTLIWQAGLIPEEVLGDATVSFDGMLHDAASRMGCSTVQQSCYQPSTPGKPRACPAKEKGQRGCACDSIACQQACRHATPRDPQARYVWYSGSNRTDHPNATTSPDGAAPTTGTAPFQQATPTAQEGARSAPPRSPKGEGHYGYRSLPARLIDPVQRVGWTLAEAPLASANGHEDGPAASLLKGVVSDYPWLHASTAVGDAGLGYETFLGAAYDLGVRRVVDLRADPCDRDRDGWTVRGYDDKGWVVCPFGYRLHPNGYDQERQRSKWCCRQACQELQAQTSDPSQGAGAQGGGAADPPDCPYRQGESHPLGLIKNVGKRFADGSMRLLRDMPYGSARWKEIYRRARNDAEGRNSTLEAWDLKRLPVFGTARAQATIFLADIWENLMTLARLVKEATVAWMALEGAPA